MTRALTLTHLRPLKVPTFSSTQSRTLREDAEHILPVVRARIGNRGVIKNGPSSVMAIGGGRQSKELRSGHNNAPATGSVRR